MRMITDFHVWSGIGMAMTFLFTTIGQAKGGTPLILSSPAFKDNQFIPVKYTCKGADINPPFDIAVIPDGTKTLALIVDDPDAPMGTWVHWIVFNIAPRAEIAENSIPGEQAMNDFGKDNYGGPCPPSGIHRYFFKLYALDTEFKKTAINNKRDLERAMKGHILASGQLIGLFGK